MLSLEVPNSERLIFKARSTHLHFQATGSPRSWASKLCTIIRTSVAGSAAQQRCGRKLHCINDDADKQPACFDVIWLQQAGHVRMRSPRTPWSPRSLMLLLQGLSRIMKQVQNTSEECGNIPQSSPQSQCGAACRRSGPASDWRGAGRPGPVGSPPCSSHLCSWCSLCAAPARSRCCGTSATGRGAGHLLPAPSKAQVTGQLRGGRIELQAPLKG